MSFNSEIQKLIDKVIPISSSNSISSSRRVINDHMSVVKDALKLIKDMGFGDLGDISIPAQMINGNQYTLSWNGSGFDLIPVFSGQGIKNVIRQSDILSVGDDYQYIVHNQFIIDGGQVTVSGDLIIL